MSLEPAFNLMLSLQGRMMTITRPGETPITGDVKMSPSNYSRNLEGPSETVIPGKEFVVSKSALDLIEFPRPKRGDRILDADMGTLTISEVREMFDLGGKLMGYRLRTS